MKQWSLVLLGWVSTIVIMFYVYQLRQENQRLDFETALLRSAIACSTYDCQAQVATCESRIWQVAHGGKAEKP